MFSLGQADLSNSCVFSLVWVHFNPESHNHAVFSNLTFAKQIDAIFDTNRLITVLIKVNPFA